MQKSRWIRRIILAAVWAMAASTWASIGHHLGGLPDFGPILVIGVVALILAWPQGSPRTNDNVASIALRSAVKHSR